MKASWEPLAIAVRLYSGWLRLAGNDCEAQLRKGMVPCSRSFSIACSGNGRGRHGVLPQSAQAVEKDSSEAFLPALCSNFSRAWKSQGGASPVSSLPITAPQ